MPDVIGRGEVLRLASQGATIIDVLPPREHEELRLPDSIGIWLRELDEESLRDLGRDDPVIVYCHDYL